MLLLAVLAGAWVAPRRKLPTARVRGVELWAASRLSFDLPTATILAGYAFEAYNEPSVGKRAVGGDGTAVVFTSPELIRRLFRGVLKITARGARISSGWQARQRFIESVSVALPYSFPPVIMPQIATGSLPDPYLRIELVRWSPDNSQLPP